MPSTTQPVADPYGVMHWASAMREAGDLAPMLAVVRGGVVIASGFVDPSRWPASMGIAFYGFGADAVAGVMDSWIFCTDLDAPAPDCTPQEAFEAGDPRAAEALQVMWIPRAGAVLNLWRTYAETADGITWLQLGEYDRTLVAPVIPSAVRNALDAMGDRYPADEWDDIPVDRRDQATAHHLGLELR